MVSSPTFDPHLMIGRQRGKNHRLLQMDKRKPLLNLSLIHISLEESGKHCKRRAGRSCRSDVRGEIFPCCCQGAYVTLVKNLQESLGERIQNLAWMGDSTKVKALEKLR